MIVSYDVVVPPLGEIRRVAVQEHEVDSAAVAATAKGGEK
jgi:hypothetical protein